MLRCCLVSGFLLHCVHCLRVQCLKRVYLFARKESWLFSVNSRGSCFRTNTSPGDSHSLFLVRIPSLALLVPLVFPCHFSSLSHAPSQIWSVQFLLGHLKSKNQFVLICRTLGQVWCFQTRVSQVCLHNELVVLYTFVHSVLNDDSWFCDVDATNWLIGRFLGTCTVMRHAKPEQRVTWKKPRGPYYVPVPGGNRQLWPKFQKSIENGWTLKPSTWNDSFSVITIPSSSRLCGVSVV